MGILSETDLVIACTTSRLMGLVLHVVDGQAGVTGRWADTETPFVDALDGAGCSSPYLHLILPSASVLTHYPNW